VAQEHEAEQPLAPEEAPAPQEQEAEQPPAPPAAEEIPAVEAKEEAEPQAPEEAEAEEAKAPPVQEETTESEEEEQLPALEDCTDDQLVAMEPKAIVKTFSAELDKKDQEIEALKAELARRLGRSSTL